MTLKIYLSHCTLSPSTPGYFNNLGVNVSSIRNYLITKKRSFQANLIQHLEDVEERNPTAFWELYDQLSSMRKRASVNTIDTSVWVDY